MSKISDIIGAIDTYHSDMDDMDTAIQCAREKVSKCPMRTGNICGRCRKYDNYGCPLLVEFQYFTNIKVTVKNHLLDVVTENHDLICSGLNHIDTEKEKEEEDGI